MTHPPSFDFDVAIIGAGPAGLSAAITLGRARRRVIVFDHGQPRNHAAKAVHCFLGHDGIAPSALRATGREEAIRYGAEFHHSEVIKGECLSTENSDTAFIVRSEDREVRVRSILISTGMVDQLPEIPGVEEEYGRSVFHCPFCDGWEFQDRTLVAYGKPESATKLARTLLAWSADVHCLTDGEKLSTQEKTSLGKLGVKLSEKTIHKIIRSSLASIVFDDGDKVNYDALFFSSGQAQRSPLPSMMGCKCDDKGKMVTQSKQCTSIKGVYVAGDADGDVQFAIVAAAEGAIAATDIHQLLLDQEQAV